MSAVLEAIRDHARSHPGDVAVFDDHVRLSYAQLEAEIRRVADSLASISVGDRPIASLLDNSAAWVVLDLAMTAAGIASVPLPPFFTEEQSRHAISTSGAVRFISQKPAPSIPGGITTSGRHLSVLPCDTDAAILPARTAKVTFTSGSTGRPKGVCLTGSALEEVATSLVDVIGPEYAGTHLASLPLPVLLENVAGLYPTLLAGGTYCVPSLAQIGFSNPFAPDFAALVSSLVAQKATSTILVPELLRGLLAALDAAGHGLPDMKLVAVGGAMVPTALLDKACALGLPVYQGYGLSEAGSVVALNTPHRNRDGSVGRLLPHIRATLAPDGEVLVAQPAFLGYVGGDEAPPVFRTGDLGRFDADGFLFFEGRKSNVIVTSHGRNIAPEWIEAELLGQPAIGQAMVFGAGERALAALVVPSSMQVTDRQLASAIDAVNADLPQYACVKHWAKVMPFTPRNGQLTENARPRRKAIEEAYDGLMRACFQQEGQYVTFFERLVAETRAEQQYLQASPQIQDGLEGKISREAYLDYLTEAYHHVRHTVPLMKLVEQHLPREKEWLRDVLAEYVEEETGHEEWILDDIGNAGGDRMAARLSEPRAATEFMVAYAYDFIRRVNPVGFFGMIFVLEGTSTQLATRGANALMQSLGLGPDCFRYLLSHGSIDLEHIQFLRNTLNRIDDPEDQAAVIHMAKRMFVLFGNVFRSIPYKAGEARVA